MIKISLGLLSRRKDSARDMQLIRAFRCPDLFTPKGLWAWGPVEYKWSHPLCWIVVSMPPHPKGFCNQIPLRPWLYPVWLCPISARMDSSSVQSCHSFLEIYEEIYFHGHLLSLMSLGGRLIALKPIQLWPKETPETLRVRYTHLLGLALETRLETPTKQTVFYWSDLVPNKIIFSYNATAVYSTVL